MPKLAAQVIAGSDLFQPFIQTECLAFDTTRPDAIDQETGTVVWSRMVVYTFNADHTGKSLLYSQFYKQFRQQRLLCQREYLLVLSHKVSLGNVQNGPDMPFWVSHRFELFD